jgi:hypothetical protein
VLGARVAPAIGKRVIIAFGGIAFNTLIPNSGSIEDWRGFTIDGGKYGLVVGTRHPSFVKRGSPELTPLLAFDIGRAVEVANGEFTNYPTHPDFQNFDINIHPTIEDAWSFYYLCKDNPKLVIAFDIETPRTGWVTEEERGDIEDAPITQIQFSVNLRTAIVFKWEKAFISVVLSLFRLDNVKANHYAYNFDIPKLIAAGVTEIRGKIHDTLWMFKHWHPRLPRGLQNVSAMCEFPYPWKHMFGDEMEWYGGCDVIAVHYILRWLPEKMKQLDVWRGYIEEIFEMYSILQYGRDGAKSAAQRGIPVNDVARLELKEVLQGERDALNDELQKEIPDEIRNVRPKRKQENGAIDYGYIREPKEVQEARAIYNIAAEKRVKRGITTHPTFDTFIRKKYGLIKRPITGTDSETGEEITIERWCKVDEFKASRDGLVRYIEWKKRELEK